MNDDYIKLPRLYVDQELKKNGLISLTDAQNHYLRTVLRRHPGDFVRLFNGTDGEWVAAITELDKKRGTLTPDQEIRPQPPAAQTIHLAFAPIKKQRLEWAIEKAVELGVASLHPVITNRTEKHYFNTDRIERQLIEAAEQCERLDVPAFHTPLSFADFLQKRDTSLPLLACTERSDVPLITQHDLAPNDACYILIGPEGGFTDDEKVTLKTADHVFPVSLGSYILRSETAICAALSALLLQRA